MLRFVEKKINLQQVFSEKIHSVVYTSYTNFSSFVALKHKFGLVYTLLHRRFTTVFDFYKFHFEEVETTLKKTLHENAYHTKFVDKCENLLIYLFKKLFLPPFQNWNLE